MPLCLALEILRRCLISWRAPPLFRTFQFKSMPERHGRFVGEGSGADPLLIRLAGLARKERNWAEASRSDRFFQFQEFRGPTRRPGLGSTDLAKLDEINCRTVPSVEGRFFLFFIRILWSCFDGINGAFIDRLCNIFPLFASSVRQLLISKGIGKYRENRFIIKFPFKLTFPEAY